MAPSTPFDDDLHVARAASGGDADALAVLDRVFLAEIPRYVRHLDASPAFADEVTQGVRVRFLVAEAGDQPRLAQYSGQGSLASFIKICAVRVGLDLLRAAGRPLDDGGRLELLPAGEDVELDYVRALHRDDFDDSLRAAFRARSPEERTLLRLLYLDRVSVGELAKLYDLSISAMSRRLTNLRAALCEATKRALAERLGGSHEDLSSLVRLLDSGVEVSLARFLSNSERGEEK